MRKDWIEIRLGDFLDFKGGGTPRKNRPEYWHGDIPWASIKDIKGKYLQKTGDNITVQGLNNSSANIAEPNQIILATRINPGRPIITKIRTSINQDLKIVIPKITIDRDFLYFLFATLERKILKVSSGTTVLGINLNNLKEIQAAIPPLPEQRSIVAKIEELFGELDNGVTNLKRAQEQLKFYRQAVLKKAFDGELTKGWREKKKELPSTSEILRNINNEHVIHYRKQIENWKNDTQLWAQNGQQGRKPSRPRKFREVKSLDCYQNRIFITVENTSHRIVDCLHSTPKFQSTGKFCVDTTCISNGKILWDKIRYVTKESFKNRISRLKPKRGDIFFAREGTVGTTLVLDQDIDVCLGQRMMMFRPIESIIPKYFMYYFQSNEFKKQYKPLIGGTTAPHLNIGIIRKLIFPVCSTQEQHQIVQEIESRLSVCDKLEETISESLEKAKALRQSILKKAFAGELLTQQELEACKAVPDWEPAQQLLQRIKGGNSQVPKPQIATRAKATVKSISTTDMHAGVITKIIRLHENNPKYLNKLSHVKCEKIAHLSEYYVGLDLGRVPRKDAAGPDDYPHLKKVESRAQKASFFTKMPRDIGYSYKTSRQADALVQKVDAFLDEEQAKKLEYLLRTFLKFDLEQSEIVATTYAGWNNLLLDGLDPTDEQIVYESRENWSRRKLNIPRERFFKAITWMQEYDLVPQGTGFKVEKPIVKKRRRNA